MFIDFREHPRDQLIETDVCIIGAGAAGISLTQALAGSDLDVCLLETGGFSPDAVYDQLAEVEPQPGDYRTNGCRLRFFGGSTNHWGGNNMPLDALDFEVRPWVEHSGWPISRADLNPWYVQANRVLNIGAFAYTHAEMLDASCPFDDINLELLHDVYWRLTPNPTTFSAAYKEAFEQAANVRVLLHATATALHTDAAGRTVQFATIKNPQGNQTRIKAKRFVVAAGAMESSRLLLASRDVNTAGVGNDNDLVGRYFMMHPHVDIGRVAGLDGQFVSLFDRHIHQGVEVAAGLAPSAASQRTNKILNGAVMLQGLPNETSGYVAMMKLRTALYLRYVAWRADIEGAELGSQAGEWAWLALTDIDSVVSGLWHRYRDPSYTGEVASGTANIYLQAEQAPNPLSRIVLGKDIDALGVPRMLVDTEVLPIDKHTLRVIGELLGRELGLLNAGRVQLEAWLLDETVEWQPQIWGGCHHMGTTRMSDDPASGVVDKNCRLHSIDNTYVASSAVFSTGGHANPTLTIVALALRLAEHLKTTTA